jgi:hypothetical protein
VEGVSDRESTVLHGSVVANDLDRPDIDQRLARGSFQAVTEAPETSPRSSSRVDNARRGRRDQLAASGLGGVETPVQRWHAASPRKRTASCGAHGCSSLKRWVASVGRTRPGHLGKAGGSLPARLPSSGGAEAPSTGASRSKSSESAREHCSPRVDNQVEQIEQRAKALLSPGTTEGASGRSWNVLNRTPAFGPWPSGSTVFGSARSIGSPGITSGRWLWSHQPCPRGDRKRQR